MRPAAGKIARVLIPGLLLLAPAAAGAQVRTGEAAFGDWSTDAPGVIRHILPDDLPAPRATRSASRGPDIVRRPGPDTVPHVPPGFHAEQIASGLDMPRVIRVAPNGDVFLAESGAGRVLILHDKAAPSVFAADLTQPYGIGFWPPGPQPRFVYVAETNRVVRYPYASGDQLPRGRAEIVVRSLQPGGSHWTRDLAFSADGKRMFISVGSSNNMGQTMASAPPAGFVAAHPLGAAWGDEEDRAVVLSAQPDGGDLRIFATGLRNCSGLATQPASDTPWCATNERDGLGDDLPPDFATAVRPGAFYGWPWYYIGAHEDSRGRGSRPDLAGQVTVPDVLIQPHSAPLGITFYNAGQFPADYSGDAFVTLHGSWNRAKRTGYKVIRLRFRDGKPTGEYEDFLTGFVLSDAAVWGRPVGVAVDKDGALLVSEDGNGTVWRVTYRP